MGGLDEGIVGRVIREELEKEDEDLRRAKRAASEACGERSERERSEQRKRFS